MFHILTLFAFCFLTFCSSVSDLMAYLSSTAWATLGSFFLALQRVFSLKSVNWPGIFPSNQSLSACHHFPLYHYFPYMAPICLCPFYHIYQTHACVFREHHSSYSAIFSFQFCSQSNKIQLQKERQSDSFPERLERFSNLCIFNPLGWLYSL